MKQPTVLAVDDKASNLVAMEALFDDLDANLVCASSGEEALSVLAKHEVAVVLLDVQMPAMDGYEVAELMRQQSRTSTVPIIFVTAINRDINHVMRGYASGAVDFITKPVDPEILRSKVRVFLDLDQKTRALARANLCLQQSLQEVERLRHHNDQLLRSIGEGIVSLDRRGHVLFANPSSQTLVGELTPLAGTRFSLLLADDDAREAFGSLLENCLAGESWREVFPIRRHNQTFPAEVVATPLKGEDGVIGGVTLVFQDITERQQRESELRATSEQDPLTGLANRRGLTRVLRQRLACSADKAALLYLDLDRFKEVNDQLGHQAGDEVLQEVARRFSDVLRQSDLLARMGGDEFCILLDADNPLEAAQVVAEKLIQSLRRPMSVNGHLCEVGTSIGIAQAESPRDLDGMIARADRAMYQAKRHGTNRYRVASESPVTLPRAL